MVMSTPLTPPTSKTTPLTGVKTAFLDRQPPRWGTSSHPYKTFFRGVSRGVGEL